MLERVRAEKCPPSSSLAARRRVRSTATSASRSSIASVVRSLTNRYTEPAVTRPTPANTSASNSRTPNRLRGLASSGETDS